jgi:hypothetical protein
VIPQIFTNIDGHGTGQDRAVRDSLHATPRA